jgi:ABC-type Zn uptake system ZnuABC Zn-binding protein ZnuA/ABC-type Mn2+/Zn2+ transport system permease subunit
VHWLTDPWASELMRRAFTEAVLVGAACGALGCFVVVRGLAFLGEALSHILILGAVVALLAGGPVGVGAFAAAAVAVWLAAIVSSDRRFSPDTAMGILLPSFFGLAVVLIALSDARRSKLEGLLFGSILSVEPLDLALAGGVVALAAALIAVAGKELALAAFDRRMARAMGYRLRVLDLALFAVVALAAIVALHAVGNVLVAALLLGPPLVARQLSRSFAAMVGASAVIGAGAGVAGLYWSWHMDVGAGAAIVLVIAALYALVAIVSLAWRLAPARRAAVAGALLVLAGAGVLGGCGSGGGGSGKLRVVATTMQLQDMTRQVGGDLVQVDGILGPDSEPHTYEPRPSDADAIARADVVVQHGAGLDDWLGDLVKAAGGHAKRVTATDGIRLVGGDPHVWHDPANAKAMVTRIESALVTARPAAATRFRARAQSYRDRLDRMARAIRTLFATVPRQRRKLVTSHDAFGYFARAYGVDVVGSVLPSLTTEVEPSGEQIRSLVRDIRRAGVRTIFTEAAVNAKLERQVAAEAGARVATDLYADVLGRRGSGADTLIGAELHNARAMLESWR